MNGEFFLKRYRQLDPAAELISPSIIRQAIRVNPRRTTPEKLIDTLRGKGAETIHIPWLRHAYFAEAGFSLGATPEYLLGHYYLQGPLSQLACEVLAPQEGCVVLDMAAAPGGKTTYLAELVTDKGIVVALDIDMGRLAAVRNNAERLGLPNIVCIKKDARFARDLKKSFRSIILDAPCSGNYCSEPGWTGQRTIHDIKANSRVQKELLKAAWQALEPGGKLLYSTCSLEPEEDELVVDWALKRYGDLSVVPLDHLDLGDQGAVEWEGVSLERGLSGTRRFWPHKTGMEGFFIALLEKAK